MTLEELCGLYQVRYRTPHRKCAQGLMRAMSDERCAVSLFDLTEHIASIRTIAGKRSITEEWNIPLHEVPEVLEQSRYLSAQFKIFDEESR